MHAHFMFDSPLSRESASSVFALACCTGIVFCPSQLGHEFILVLVAVLAVVPAPDDQRTLRKGKGWAWGEVADRDGMRPARCRGAGTQRPHAFLAGHHRVHRRPALVFTDTTLNPSLAVGQLFADCSTLHTPHTYTPANPHPRLASLRARTSAAPARRLLQLPRPSYRISVAAPGAALKYGAVLSAVAAETTVLVPTDTTQRGSRGRTVCAPRVSFPNSNPAADRPMQISATRTVLSVGRLQDAGRVADAEEWSH
ncbi:hypothetical protein B0H10DRAFT_2226166 [Mycena sp. CBHHK59/15]|nr:hypothetical protein B0H10DRAFT_2226166 [Mycena sp. CBHHK59/15]